MSRLRAFSLAEVMIAILFISIALFGYVALHSRLLYSGRRLEDLEVKRNRIATISAVDQVRARKGVSTGALQNSFVAVNEVAGLVKTTTLLQGFGPPVLQLDVGDLDGNYEVDLMVLPDAESVAWPTAGANP